MNNPDSKKIVVGRHINSITLNDLEYLLDDDGEIKEFNSEKEAKTFLKQNGISAKYLDGFVNEETDGGRTKKPHGDERNVPSESRDEKRGQRMIMGEWEDENRYE
jgi:hypothetical protein